MQFAKKQPKAPSTQAKPERLRKIGAKRPRMNNKTQEEAEFQTLGTDMAAV